MPTHSERQRATRTDNEVVHLEWMTKPRRGEAVRQYRDRVVATSRETVLDQGDHERGIPNLLEARWWSDRTTTNRPTKVGHRPVLASELQHRAGRGEPHRRRPVEFVSPVVASEQRGHGIDNLPEPEVGRLTETHDLSEPNEELRRVVVGVRRAIEEERAPRVGGRSSQSMSLSAGWKLNPAESGDLGSPTGRNTIAIGKGGEVDRCRTASMGERHLQTGTMSEGEHRRVPLDGDALRQTDRGHPSAHQITSIEDDGHRRPRLVVERHHGQASPIGNAANRLHDVSAGYPQAREGDWGAVEEFLPNGRIGFGVVPPILGRDEPAKSPRTIERSDRSAGRHLGAPPPSDHSGDDHPDSQARSTADRTGCFGCS